MLLRPVNHSAVYSQSIFEQTTSRKRKNRQEQGHNGGTCLNFDFDMTPEESAVDCKTQINFCEEMENFETNQIIAEEEESLDAADAQVDLDNGDDNNHPNY